MQRIFLWAWLVLFLLAACGTPVAAPADAPAAWPAVTVYKSPTCGCCGAWSEHLEANGFAVTVEDSQNLAKVTAELGIPTELQACHTAIVDGYIVSGHVPASEVKRLLETRPDIVGLAVLGMPVGSPGMEVEGADPQPFDVLAWDKAGKTTVYARYPQ